jgi:hypothetical protein
VPRQCRAGAGEGCGESCQDHLSQFLLGGSGDEGRGEFRDLVGTTSLGLHRRHHLPSSSLVTGVVADHPEDLLGTLVPELDPTGLAGKAVPVTLVALKPQGGPGTPAVVRAQEPTQGRPIVGVDVTHHPGQGDRVLREQRGHGGRASQPLDLTYLRQIHAQAEAGGPRRQSERDQQTPEIVAHVQ